MNTGIRKLGVLLGAFALWLALSQGASTIAQTCVEPPGGLVGWWPGDGAADDIAGSLNGILQNGAGFDAGAVRQAFELDGVNDRVLVADPNRILALPSFTYDLWLYPTAVPPGRSMRGFSTFRQGGGVDAGAILSIDPESVQVPGGSPTKLIPRFDIYTSAQGLSLYDTTVTIPLNQWTHVALTVEDSTKQLRAYVNGNSLASLRQWPTGSPFTGTFLGTVRYPAPIRAYIGAEEQRTNEFVGHWIGYLDEIEVHDRALSAAEIAAIFAAGSAGKCWLPTSDAGPDVSQDEGSLVTLDGTASHDPLGKPITYSWGQIAGPSVQLSDGTSAAPSFTAPSVPVGGLTLTFQLVVASPLGSSAPDAVNVTVRNLNHPPVAEAGDDQVAPENGAVSLDGSASYDLDDEALAFSWAQAAGAPVSLGGAETARPSFTAPMVGAAAEILTFVLTVSDGIETGSDSVDVQVTNVNQPPVADAGADASVNEGSIVSLDGTESYDPDDDAVSYVWSQTAGTPVVLSDALTETPSFTAPYTPAGGDILSFELIVSDGLLDSMADSIAIAVLNVNDPPSCALASPDPVVLWPPSHKLRAVGLTGVADPQGDMVLLSFNSVTSDEPTSGFGDGDTSPDALVQDGMVLLRAERWDQGNGRVYTVDFTATDSNGESCAGSVRVSVPKSMKKDTPAIDDGQVYDATMP